MRTMRTRRAFMTASSERVPTFLFDALSNSDRVHCGRMGE
jgi:hypothetical protein